MCILELGGDWIIFLYFLCVQPGPDSVGIFAISQKCNGVAARACGLVSLEPMKVLRSFFMFPHFNAGSKNCSFQSSFLFIYLVRCILFNCRLLRYSKIDHLGSATAGALKFSQCSLLVMVERSSSYICRWKSCLPFHLVFLFFSFSFKEKLQILSDICTDDSGSCTWLLDPEIHYKPWQRQFCGILISQTPHENIYIYIYLNVLDDSEMIFLFLCVYFV